MSLPWGSNCTLGLFVGGGDHTLWLPECSFGPCIPYKGLEHSFAPKACWWPVGGSWFEFPWKPHEASSPPLKRGCFSFPLSFLIFWEEERNLPKQGERSTGQGELRGGRCLRGGSWAIGPAAIFPTLLRPRGGVLCSLPGSLAPSPLLFPETVQELPSW